ncbi:hypothetical protein [Streptomyces sp. NPDC056069]|uniref:hypothetical protein n=1 Tax=Streptomyces sp. NPDC056069 TaxID=3345702 RepID=UPI0035D8A265
MTAPAEDRELPRYEDLTHGQHMGWNCVWCDKRITSGGRDAGRVGAEYGAHQVSVPVYAGPCCARRRA